MLTLGPIAGLPLASGPLTKLVEISGDSSIQFLPTSLLKGSGNTGLTSSLILSPTGLVKGFGNLTQTTSRITILPNGSIRATANVAMTSSLNFVVAGIGGLIIGIDGSSTIELISFGNANRIIGRLATSQFTLTGNGNIGGIGHANTNIFGVQIYPNGELVGSGSIESEDAFSIISSSSDISGIGSLFSNIINFTLDGSALLKGSASSNGHIDFTILPEGLLASVASLEGTSLFELISEGNIEFFNAIYGDTSFNVEYGNTVLSAIGNLYGDLPYNLIPSGLLTGTASTNLHSNINLIVNNSRLFSNIFGASQLKSDIFIPHLTARGKLEGTEDIILSASSDYLNSIIFGNSALTLETFSSIGGTLPFDGRGNIILNLTGLVKGKAAASSSSTILSNTSNINLRGVASTTGNSDIILSLPNAPILYLRNGNAISNIKFNISATELIAAGILKADGELNFQLVSIPSATLGILGSTYLHLFNSGKLHNYNITNAIKNSKISLLSVQNYKPIIEKMSDNWYIVKVIKTTGRL